MKLRNKGQETFGAIATACAVVAVPTASHAADSIWSAGVGKILPTDETAWCVYNLTATNPVTITAKFQKRGSDGSIITDPYTDAGSTLAAKMQCTDANGNSTVVGGNQFGNSVTIKCPANQFFSNVRCMIHSTDHNPFAYGYGAAGLGDPCSNGVAQINVPNNTVPQTGYKGQITGYVRDLTFQPADRQPWNKTLMQNAQVYGTDMGFMFHAHGMLWSGYGDTWANKWKTPVSPSGTRGSVLFQTFDLDASDGLGFASYVGQNTTGYAQEVIRSCHNSSAPCLEQTAIPSAGFGLNDGGTPYTVLWFLSIRRWNVLDGTIDSNGGRLAWHNLATGGEFARTAPISNKVPPKWSGTSAFGAGAIYQDRYNGYIYFFGQKAYAPNTPIRLARVRAKFASVMDATQYEYWSGNPAVGNAGWEPAPTNAPLTPSELSHFDSRADIIGPNVAAGPEFSVIFNPYVNRFLMLLISNRSVPGSNAMQVWEASSLTGPWTKKSGDFTNLPNGQMLGTNYWYFYGPYANEQIMGGEGRTVYYQLSEFNTLDVAPYNVGLWAFDVVPASTPGCKR